jgi:hypothetical protein
LEEVAEFEEEVVFVVGDFVDGIKAVEAEDFGRVGVDADAAVVEVAGGGLKAVEVGAAGVAAEEFESGVGFGEVHLASGEK